MATLFRSSLRLLPVSAAVTCRSFRFPPNSSHLSNRKLYSSSSSPSSLTTKAGWLLGLGDKKKKVALPDIVAAGDPVLHEKAREVDPEEIGSERIQKIIDDMVKVMRLAPGVGLAAPQIGVPLRVSIASLIAFLISHFQIRMIELVYMVIQIIVLEDTKEYISYAPKEEILAQERRPFDLLVIKEMN